MTTTQLWIVQLAKTHKPYPRIVLKRDLPDNSDFTVVVVDMKKFMACVRRDEERWQIPAIQNWLEGKQAGISKYLDPADTGVPVMARPSIQEVRVKRWFGLKSPITFAVVSFTNGRHRASYMEYAGAKTMPVEVRVSQVALFQKYCI
jgi:hypothetical protein